MSKQEEIRGGIADIVADNEQPDGVDVGRATLQIIHFLHSQGVVIKKNKDEPYELVAVEPLTNYELHKRGKSWRFKLLYYLYWPKYLIIRIKLWWRYGGLQ